MQLSFRPILAVLCFVLCLGSYIPATAGRLFPERAPVSRVRGQAPSSFRIGAHTAPVFHTTAAAVHIPKYAKSSGNLTGSSHWQWEHDGGTPCCSTGDSQYPAAIASPDGKARSIDEFYSQYAGERFHLFFGLDTKATHFIYDTYVLITDPLQILNLELDVNQVMEDGRTVIYGVQCSGYSGTWEYTTMTAGGWAHWHRSNLPCSPRGWTANTWHHVQIASHRDSDGNVTYDWVSLDGIPGYFDHASGSSAQDLHWGVGMMVLNFQFEGYPYGDGVIHAYIDNMKIYRW